MAQRAAIVPGVPVMDFGMNDCVWGEVSVVAIQKGSSGGRSDDQIGAWKSWRTVGSSRKVNENAGSRTRSKRSDRRAGAKDLEELGASSRCGLLAGTWGTFSLTVTTATVGPGQRR
jgi:hypothetical protein